MLQDLCLCERTSGEQALAEPFGPPVQCGRAQHAAARLNQVPQAGRRARLNTVRQLSLFTLAAPTELDRVVLTEGPAKTLATLRDAGGRSGPIGAGLKAGAAAPLPGLGKLRAPWVLVTPGADRQA
jgi:hypothetical protein